MNEVLAVVTVIPLPDGVQALVRGPDTPREQGTYALVPVESGAKVTAEVGWMCRGERFYGIGICDHNDPLSCGWVTVVREAV